MLYLYVRVCRQSFIARSGMFAKHDRPEVNGIAICYLRDRIQLRGWTKVKLSGQRS